MSDERKGGSMRRRTVNVDPTGEEIAKRLAAGELPALDVETRAAFEQAVTVMIRTGRPIRVPSRSALDEWVGPLDERDEGDQYDG